MGWATKKNKTWELRHLMWTFASIILFLPLPVHIHPFVMMSQASKSKVRSWYLMAWTLLLVELALFGSFLFFFGAMSQGMLLTLGGSVVSYILGNGLLLNQAKPYLKRLEVGEVRPLTWIGSVERQQRLELAQASMETPQSFVTKMLHYRKEINNANIHQHIDKIIRLFHLLEQKDMMEAEKFLVRHGTVINVLRQYDELENTRLHNQITIDSKVKLESVLAQAAIAIEQDVTNIIKSSLLDVSAESDVYIQTLKNRNLLKE
ncbi:hypothetical protein FAZ19_14675 [Sphingobacterium alkalisoli]|uniref:Uncharacterized protein n=1 Tax=Sphingobacterium alkalisoli TaxID=1874115 RepID=A0A4U0H2E9_9SPHI|nr:hypothetical protein [Sphingobacterium alkalisoli]TJY64442.1 hypothetical protein FAZ19_14675 [Sphingobacterium alkalisoli]GGH21748.1 hypothetical protein GCM10011418_27790 [Sphingobacterium alkalisoli]